MDSTESPISSTSTPASPRETSPWTIAFIVMMSTLVGFAFIGPFIGAAAAYPFYPGKPFEFLNDIVAPDGKEYMKTPIWVIQGVTTFVGLALIPALFWARLKHRKIFSRLRENPRPASYFLLTLGITITFMVVSSVFVEWNANVNLPDGAFETWARNIEDRAMELTKFMTSFNSFGEYLGGAFVIAVLAGFSEELVFRGFLQPELQKATRNVHAGIWISAIFFSALHLQFYGFVPRVLLGALFGYLYFWSGNLWLAMFAHFLNNFIGVTSIYAGLSDLPGAGLDDSSMPWWAVAIGTILFAGLMYVFYTKLFKREITTPDTLDRYTR